MGTKIPQKQPQRWLLFAGIKKTGIPVALLILNSQYIMKGYQLLQKCNTKRGYHPKVHIFAHI
jgi:hypothetical protein